ncbi:MAG: Asp-tRNA(Asn)/Glu-tRNA(Gln) amidotransferase GatCAB subunit A, partial [Actinobacteria bacterium]|nr:Asp-tRNA(Asn)/Glu-tRNA(Gln) amidotransferase GatCAB subunit A [Actinomycetota bacterium]
MLIRESASKMAEALANKEVSAVELTNQHFEQIEAVDKDVHAFLYLDKEGAISQAADIDKRRAAGEKLSPLAGIPLALKDVLTQKGVPTTCGSKILAGWRPPY